MITYKQLSLADIFSDSCGRMIYIYPEKTLHSDLLLAGIAQLLTVIVADKIHKHQYIRSLKPLIA